MSRKEILLDNKNNFTLGEAAEIFKIYQQNPTLAAQDLLQLEDGLPWHQRLALKIAWNSPNTIMIWTRGGGKSLGYNIDSIVLTKERGLISVTELIPSLEFKHEEYWLNIPKVHLWNGDDWQETDKILVQKSKDSRRIRTSRNYELEGSTNHLIQVLDEKCEIVWQRFNTIKEGQLALIGRKVVDSGNIDNDSYLAGLLIGDGSIRQAGLTITSEDKEIISFVESYTGASKTHDIRTKGTYSLRIPKKFSDAFLETYDVPFCLSYDKVIPFGIKMRSFLQGLFDADGTVEKNKRCVSLCSVSHRLIKQVHTALLTFGIISKWREKKTASKFGKSWILDITGVEAKKFIDRIGFRLTRKQETAKCWTGEYNTNNDTIPGAQKLIIELKSKYRFPLDESNKRWRSMRSALGKDNRKSMSAKAIATFMNLLPEAAKSDPIYAKLTNLLKINEDYYFDPIVSIEDYVADCIDFNIPVGEKYWANGFINHNTWFNAMYALLRAMCYPNEKVGIFSASFRQAKFVWAEIEKMYSNSAIVKECCYKRPMSPPDKCYLQLKNGSIIEALPLGDGQKIRGARYFDIVTDEVAQIPEDIFDIVIRGMTATSKDPMAEVKKLKAQQELLKLGLITEEQLYTPTANKILMTSTAFYRFNHLWKRVELFDNEIRKPENANLNPNILVDNGPDGTKVMWNKERALIMFDYMDPPKGFMKESSIKEARLKMSENKFKMEYCFASDTEIITPFGAKNIADIQVNDLVLSHEGKWETVLNIKSRNVVEDLVEIHTYGYNRPILSTVEHPYFTGEDWTRAENLEYTTKVKLQELFNNTHGFLKEFVTQTNSSIINGVEFIHPVNRKGINKKIGNKKFKGSLQNRITYNYDLGLVLGYYASEGSVGANGKQVQFALDGHKDIALESFVEELQTALSRSFGVVSKKLNRSDNTIIIYVNSRILADFFKKVCPGVSATKYCLPSLLWSNAEFLKGFLRGVWHGDGCINSKPQAIYVSKSRNLAMQIHTAMTYFGFTPIIRDIKDCMFTSIELKGDASILFDNWLNNKDNKTKDSSLARHYIIPEKYKISSIRRVPYTGKVYNLEVQGGNSYSLPNATVHNCAYFPPDSEGFFRRSKVEKARNHDLFTIEQHGEPGSNYVLGIDVARKSDNFAITVAKIAGEKLHVVNVITLNNKSFNDMHDLIRRVIRTYNVVHICMDTGGGGTTLQDMLEDERLLADGDRLIYDSINDNDKLGREGLHILDMVKFSDDSIPQMGFQMASDLDHGRLLLPCIPNRRHRLSDDLTEKEAEKISSVLRKDEDAYQEIEHLIEETTSIIATSTRTGRIHLGLPSEVVGADSKKDFEDGMKAPRKDRWTSCMLAVWAWHRCTNLEKYEQVSEPAYGFALRK